MVLMEQSTGVHCCVEGFTEFTTRINRNPYEKITALGRIEDHDE